MRKRTKRVLDYLVIFTVALLGAFNYQIFVFPNDFAPSGINGILTIIRYVFGVNFGMLYLFINIPLLIAAFFVMRSRKYVICSFIYVVVFSVASIL
ncbi:MAG: YitT family protein, partial [Spirochaetales bacterium]|nr:YitT family protein [Spirochaetales bacterium]